MRRAWMAVWGAALLSTLFACSSAKPIAPRKGPSSAAASAASSAVRSLPPGVLDEAKTEHGLVRVEERDGMRLLTINGQVQGGRRIDPAVQMEGDPLVALVTAARPEAKKALVLGLGTGRTATELASRGLAVQAVEINEKVADFARRYFDFRGEVKIQDAMQYLESPPRGQFDVVVLDVSVSGAAPEMFFMPEPTRGMIASLTPRGIIATRFVEEVRTENLAEIARYLGGGAPDSRWDLHFHAM